MMRLFRIGALCVVALGALQASAMPLGYRLSRQARAAVRQAEELPSPEPTQEVWTVTFDAQGGTAAEATRSVTNGCAVGELPAATLNGYTLSDWFTAAEGGELATAETLVTNDVVFYAHWTPSEVVNVAVDGDKGGIEKTDNRYVVTAKDGVSLTEGDFTFGAIAKEAYKIEIASDGKSATVTLAAPQIGVAAAEETDEKDAEDATGLLVVVEEAEISARPTPKAEACEEVGALPVKTYPGLFYQASWGDDLSGLTLGEKVQATGESLYLGVIKQTGDKGFYKVSVNEK